MFDAPEVRGSFGFVQFEFGHLVGPADGRYLTRAAPDHEPEFIVVLRTLGAPQRRFLRRRRPRPVERLDAAPVPTTRASVVGARPLGSSQEAEDWLRRLRSDRGRLELEIERAIRELNVLMRAYRAAAADPHARDLHPDRSLVVRVGHGSGKQVADGRFQAAYEVPRAARRGRRVERLSPQERLAAIASGRDRLLASDELVLRARSDLAAERFREAALQARIALECVLAEIGPDQLRDLRGDLEREREAVSEAAAAALEGDPPAALRDRIEAAVRAMETALRRQRHRSA